MFASATLPLFARVLFAGTVVVWALNETRQSFRHRSEGVRTGWSSEIAFRLAVTVGALATIAVVRLTTHARIHPVAVAAGVGIVLLWCGLALRFWSFRTLGRYFTFILQTSADQPVITDGPYRVIRHPSYAGILLAVLGVGFYVDRWWALATLTIPIGAALVYRIRVEERALIDNLSDDYRAYAATHQRLIPGVW